jgi:hypothetical protein
MKPKAQTEHEEGLLEYLEDIIGTSSYKEPIEVAQKSIEELNEKRIDKINRFSMVEKERSSLEVGNSTIRKNFAFIFTQEERFCSRFPLFFMVPPPWSFNQYCCSRRCTDQEEGSGKIRPSRKRAQEEKVDFISVDALSISGSC